MPQMRAYVHLNCRVMIKQLVNIQDFIPQLMILWRDMPTMNEMDSRPSAPKRGRRRQEIHHFCPFESGLTLLAVALTVRSHSLPRQSS